MAQHRTPAEYEEMALKAIQDYKLLFISDIPPYLGISRARFYQLELDKLDTIKDALVKNHTDIKVSLRKKWFESDNSATQIVLYKLIADDHERKKMTQNYTDVTTKDMPVSTNPFAHLSNEQMDKLGEELTKLSIENRDEYKPDSEQSESDSGVSR